MTYQKLYLTISNGRLIIFDINKSTIESVSKIDNKVVSKPFINENNIFIIKDRSVIKFN